MLRGGQYGQLRKRGWSLTGQQLQLQPEGQLHLPAVHSQPDILVVLVWGVGLKVFVVLCGCMWVCECVSMRVYVCMFGSSGLWIGRGKRLPFYLPLGFPLASPH